MHVDIQRGGVTIDVEKEGNTTSPYHVHSITCPEKDQSLNASPNAYLVDHQTGYVKVFFQGSFGTRTTTTTTTKGLHNFSRDLVKIFHI